jgi:hypothetical protein
MVADKSRITHKIALPSYALRQFLRKTIFDEESYATFMENSIAALKRCGVELDPCLSEEALMRLRFLIFRAHDYVVKQKIDAVKFEELFGIVVSNLKLQDIKLGVAVELSADSSTDVYYLEQNSESNRGSNTEWNKADALTDTRSDHYSVTKFQGKEIGRPDDRFARVPLLDAVTLGTLIAKVEAKLNEVAR